MEKYGDHNDAVTVIDPKRSYSVKAPTRHPIYENFRVEVYYLKPYCQFFRIMVVDDDNLQGFFFFVFFPFSCVY